jgi:hypothetical protein
MLAYPGNKRLATLTGTDEPSVRRALRLLVERKAIEQTFSPRKAWRILLASDATAGNPNPRARVFWPVPPTWREGEDQTKALRALLAALGKKNRNRVAAIALLYQFARPPKLPGYLPVPPNQTWVAQVLGTSYSTVHRAMLDAIELGIATEHDDGLLTFEDPGSWPEILHASGDSPDAAAVTPATRATPTEPCSIPVSSSARAPQRPDPSPGPPAPSPSWRDGLRLMQPALLTVGCAAANTDDYPSSSRDTHAAGPLADIERVLRSAGWALPKDVLAREVLVASIERFGTNKTISRLRAELIGPYPSYALEPLGSDLGEEFECPHQLIRCTPGAENTA